MTAAKARIEAHAKVRFEAKQVACEEKLTKRAARTGITDKTPPASRPSLDSRLLAGRPDQSHPQASRMVPRWDGISSGMKISGGGVEQCYNAQMAFDVPTRRIVASALTNAGNDNVQVRPMLVSLRLARDQTRSISNDNTRERLMPMTAATTEEKA